VLAGVGLLVPGAAMVAATGVAVNVVVAGIVATAVAAAVGAGVPVPIVGDVACCALAAGATTMDSSQLVAKSDRTAART